MSARLAAASMLLMACAEGIEVPDVATRCGALPYECEGATAVRCSYDAGADTETGSEADGGGDDRGGDCRARGLACAQGLGCGAG